MISYNDFDLYVGCDVIIARPNYSGFVKGVVSALTPKKVRVQYMNTWNYSSGSKMTILLAPDCVIVEVVQDGDP